VQEVNAAAKCATCCPEPLAISSMRACLACLLRTCNMGPLLRSAAAYTSRPLSSVPASPTYGIPEVVRCEDAIQKERARNTCRRNNASVIRRVTDSSYPCDRRKLNEQPARIQKQMKVIRLRQGCTRGDCSRRVQAGVYQKARGKYKTKNQQFDSCGLHFILDEATVHVWAESRSPAPTAPRP
jgi:hypothetical protein